MTNETRIEELLTKAAELRSVGKKKEAEACYLEAIKLNEPNFGPNQLSSKIIGSLGSLYKRTNLNKAEQLYETYGRKVWDDRFVAEELTPILSRQHKHAEVRTILRKYKDYVHNVPKSRPLDLRRNELCGCLKEAEQKTPDLTDDDMDKIEAERAKKFGR